jgi:hemerythrin superfamily protein
MSDTNNQQAQEAARSLADEHSEVDHLLNELLAALDQKDKAKSFELLDLLWARLAVHIRAEHLCLFPSILDAPQVNFTGSGGTPKYAEAKSAIDLLRHDHDFFMRELGAAVSTMRKQGPRSDDDVISKRLRDVRHSVAKVRSRLDTHNQLEENHVYKWVNVLLGESERLALTARIRHELENIPRRFQPA